VPCDEASARDIPVNELRAQIAALEEKLLDAAKTALAHRETELRLEVERTYAANIVATVREPLLVLDGKLRIITASRAFYQAFGVSPEETLGRNLYDLGNGQWNIPALRTLLEEVLPLKQSFDDFEVVHAFPGLGIRTMFLNARKLWRGDNHSEMVLLAIEDVTDRRRVEKELKRSNEDLERFSYVAAHDLRSPLRSVIHLSKMLAKRLQGRLSEEETQMQTLALEGLQRLGSLMQDILDYAKTNAVQLEMTRVPLKDALQMALANLQHHIEETGAAISAGSLPEVRGDRTQLTILLQNLIGNALKYRGVETPHIRIAAVQQGFHWELSVRDNGQGFEAEHAGQIFEPFKRLHGPDIPGSGIGLSTCKRVVERLGGRIWAESVPGGGSTFYFTLPA
jgi:PAS domain S-box-containing protein